MNYKHASDGTLELHLSDNSDRFVEIAEIIIKNLKATQVVKIDGLDQSYWEMKIKGEDFTIHREHYLGVMIFSKSSNAAAVFDQIRQLNRLNTL